MKVQEKNVFTANLSKEKMVFSNGAKSTGCLHGRKRKEQIPYSTQKLEMDQNICVRDWKQ